MLVRTKGPTRRLMRWGLILSLATIFILGCARKERRVVARVDGEKIYLDDFKTQFIRKHRNEENAEKQPMGVQKEFLQTMIDKELKILFAYQKHYDTREEYKKAVDDVMNRAAIEELYQKDIVDKIVTRAEKRELYNRLAEELRARHILIKVGQNAPEEQVDKARARIDSIAQRLKAGEDFAELAGEFSEDKSNAAKGGDLGYFKWGTMADPFQEAAFKLRVGQLSEPVQTRFGFHLIKLEDRRRVKDRKSFEEEEPRIARDLMRKKSSELRQAAKDYIDGLKKEKRVTYKEETLQHLLTEMKENPKDPFAELSSQEKAAPLVSYEGGRVTVADLAERFQEIPPFRRPGFADEKSLKDFIDNAIITMELLEIRARELGIFDQKEIKKKGQEQLEGRMLADVERDEVANRAKASEDEIGIYYNDHKDKYMNKAVATVREIYVKDEAQANRFWKQLSGIKARKKLTRTFKDMAIQKTERSSTKKKEGELTIREGTFGAIGKKAFELGEGEIAGPIKMGRAYSIIQLLDKKPARSRTLNECRSLVKRDVETEKKEKRREEWLAELRVQFQVQVFDDVLLKAFEE